MGGLKGSAIAQPPEFQVQKAALEMKPQQELYVNEAEHGVAQDHVRVERTEERCSNSSSWHFKLMSRF